MAYPPLSAHEREEIARQLVERARGKGFALTGQGGLLPSLVANSLQAGLNIELDEHLGYLSPTRSTVGGPGTSRNWLVSEDASDRCGAGRLSTGISNYPTFHPTYSATLGTTGQQRRD